MIKSFEGGRGIAAIFVALFHLGIGGVFISPIRNGYVFVDLFFVLSGFLMFSAYAKKLETSQAFQPFLIRRFGRLFPLLVFSTVAFVTLQNLIVFAKSQAVALGYIGFFKVPGLLEYKFPSAFEIFSTLTLTHSLGLFDKLIMNYASWSISVEFYAYVLFAALCFLVRGQARLMVFAIVSITGFLWVTWATIEIHHCLDVGRCFDVSYDFGFARCVYAFFLGALTCHFSQYARFNPHKLQLAALTLLVLLFSWVDAFPMVGFAFGGTFSLLLLSISKDMGFLAELLKLKPFQVLGQRSYSIYMMHPVVLLPLISYRQHIKGFMMVSTVLIVYITVLVIVSGWTYRFIENPFRNWFNRMAGVAAPADPIATPST